MARYEVQEFTICDGWINTWRDEHDQPSYFDTMHDAFCELNSFLLDMQSAVKRGDMIDAPLIEDYRIVEVKHAELS